MPVAFHCCAQSPTLLALAGPSMWLRAASGLQPCACSWRPMHRLPPLRKQRELTLMHVRHWQSCSGLCMPLMQPCCNLLLLALQQPALPLHGQHIEHCRGAPDGAQWPSIWQRIPGPATRHRHGLRHDPPQCSDQAWVSANQPDILLDPKQPVSDVLTCGYLPAGLCSSLGLPCPAPHQSHQF